MVIDNFMEKITEVASLRVDTRFFTSDTQLCPNLWAREHKERIMKIFTIRKLEAVKTTATAACPAATVSA
jgi:hypothetical protein